MKRPIRYAALLAAVALSSPLTGFAEQPQRAVAADVRAPGTVGRTTRIPDVPRMTSRPEMMAPKTEAVGEAPRTVSVERPASVEIKKDDDAEILATVDEGWFLRPTWDRGFWVMPPGGLTRFLWPSPGFINPEETLAP